MVVALFVLLVLDTTYGCGAAELSQAHGSRAAIRATAAELGDATDPTVLILGNRAVAGQVLADELEAALGTATDRSWSVGSATTEASTVTRWSATYDQHFRREDALTDVLVIGFVDTQLDDQNLVDWASIGRLDTSWRSLPERIRSADDPAAGLLVAGSRLSALVGDRRWFFDLLADTVPGQTAVPRREPRPPSTERTYGHLAELVGSASRDEVGVAVVALPTPRSYEVPDSIPKTVTAAGGRFIDLRDLGFDEADFGSGTALNPEARIDLATLLAELLVRTPG